LEKLFGVMMSLYRGTPNKGEWIVACLEGAWPKLLGDQLAAVCRPAAFHGAELVIEICDRNWEDAIEHIQPALLEKLRAVTAGEVATLSIKKTDLKK
jgi:hypothetical protein